MSAQHIVWTSDCTDKTFCTNPGTCNQGAVKLTASAMTDCSFGTFVDYLYKIDLNNDGSYDIQGNNDTVSMNMVKGTHKILWRASDNCGYLTTCSYLFTIKDCQPPNMVCINGLTQALDAPICTETFNASQFILSLSDNCTPTNQIQVTIRKFGDGTGFPSATSVSYGKCDVGTNFVEVWVKDGNGLTNSCQNYVLVQPATSGCICNPDADITMKTCVYTPGHKKLPSYVLNSKFESTSGVTTPISKIRQLTSYDSCAAPLAYNKIPFGGTYHTTLSAQTTGDALNGVSTYDLVLISKHILGLQPFQTVYQSVAADVNKNNTVTTADIVEIRKLILGIYDTFPAVRSWRLITPVANPTNFATFSLSAVKDTYNIILPDLQVDTVLEPLNFVAIKYGDINFSATPFAGESAEDRSTPALLTYEDRWLEAGETVDIPVRLGTDASLEGWQLALRVDPAYAILTDISGLPPENVGISAEGLARMLWFDSAPHDLPSGTALFTAHIKAIEPVRLSELLSLQPASLQPEYYVSGGERHGLVLQAAISQANTAVFTAPKPNPVNSATTFGVQLPAPGVVSLKITDLAGRETYRTTVELEAGNHAIALPAIALPGAGVFAYRLESGGVVETGKLVRL
jgi:hypothetical protein